MNKNTCCLKLSSDKFTFAFPTGISPKGRHFVTNTRGIDLINSFGSSTRTRTEKPKSESKKVSSYSLYPTLAFSPGLHGAMVFFQSSEQPGNIISLQTYSQIARYCKLSPFNDVFTAKDSNEASSANDSFLDVHAMRNKCLTRKSNVAKLLVAIAERKSFGLRSEIGVCVASLNKAGIDSAIKKSLQFYSESVVPFETIHLFRFSRLWASTASNLHLFSIQCLTDPLSDFSNRLCHLSLSSFYADLTHQFVSGRTCSMSIVKLFVEAARVSKFPLLAGPSQQMGNLLGIKPVPLESIEDPCFSSENYHASVKKKRISLYFF